MFSSSILCEVDAVGPVEIRKHGNEKLMPNTHSCHLPSKRSLGLVTPGSWRCSLGHYLFITFYMYICTYAYTCVCQGKGCRGQLAEVGSLLPSCRSQRLNSGPQSWWSHCPSLKAFLPFNLGSQKTSACCISRIFLSRGSYPKSPHI